MRLKDSMRCLYVSIVIILKQKSFKIMNHCSILPLCLLIYIVTSASRQQLQQPVGIPFVDGTEVIKLAKNQKFRLPINTRTITHKLEMYPDNTNECQFKTAPLLYSPLASVSFLTDETESISNMVTLSKKQKLFLVDEDHNIFSYSLDEHFLLKKLSPKSKFAGLTGKVTTLTLVPTQDEEQIYFIRPDKYYFFEVESLGLQILFQESLDGHLLDVQKGFAYRGHLILLSARSGLFIYKIDKNSKRLTLVQTMTFSPDTYFSDMEFDATTQMIYLLAMNKPLIKVYHFEPSDFPNADKTLTIFVEYDTLEFPDITVKHAGVQQKNMHIDLQISHDREQQTLMVLFWHRYHYVIAEFNYRISQQQWSFVRYFKFAMRVSQIHIINDVVAVVGSQSLGIFPYGIHPRLIDEEVNGEMTLTSMLRLNILDNGRFIGLTKNSIDYAVVSFEQQAELNCKIDQKSKLKTVKIKANLTACNSQDKITYDKYCSYQKTFNLQSMQMTVSAPLANIFYTGMIFFILLILLGIGILFALQKNKEEEIKKLEQYFQEKKKAPPQIQSERRTFNHL